MRTVIAAAVGVLMCGVAFGQEVRLQGAGATFPNPLYQRWVAEFQKGHPTVKIDYQSIGSGGGIKAITEKTVHFAGSDAPLNKKEIEALGGRRRSCRYRRAPARSSRRTTFRVWPR